MKLRRRLYFHSLKKGKVRQTWNKYNLFNLCNVHRTFPNFIRRTFFQQKWSAKSLTRAYHGEHINERKWEIMFNRRLLSVVNMSPEYMAKNDGAEQAAGRGSGRDMPTEDDLTPWAQRGKTRRDFVKGRLLERFSFPEEVDLGASAREAYARTNSQEATEGLTPYMNMTFAPQERRIDVAIFRALFASSVRQARQFVVHGAVKVNGQKMNHPSYLLNPGDMFQVDPDCVMLATGKKKPRFTPNTRSKRRRGAKAAEEGEEEAEAEAEASDEGAEATAEGEGAEEAVAEGDKEQLAKRLKFLSRVARQVLSADQKEMGVKKKQRLRAFIREAREVSSKLGRKGGEQTVTTDLVGSVNAMLKEMVLNDPKVADKAESSGAFTADETAEATAAATEQQQQQQQQEEEEGKEGEEGSASAATPKPKPKAKAQPAVPLEMSSWEAEQLAQMVQIEEDNPVDESKPYATPWEPRPYMSPFAFIPRYLEVNQNICAAVYLRHPVARRGFAEVPSPFPPPVMQLAFNWYLRRR